VIGIAVFVGIGEEASLGEKPLEDEERDFGHQSSSSALLLSNDPNIRVLNYLYSPQGYRNEKRLLPSFCRVNGF
jgi:hypothetical protein